MNLAFFFSAAGNQTWIADKDYTIVSAHKATVAGNVAVTTDKFLATAATNFTTPASTFIAETVVCFLVASGSIMISQLNFSLPKDTPLFVRSEAANTCVLTMIPVNQT